MSRTTTVNCQKTYVGIDNGVSGSIGIVSDTLTKFFLTPTISVLNYTKEKRNVTRIDHVKLHTILERVKNPFVVLERPMVNPGRFQATASALRALEATIIVFEILNIPYMFIDSKQWQKEMLPKGVKGEALKKASLDIGTRLFPQFKHLYSKDADGILIGEFARRFKL